MTFLTSIVKQEVYLLVISTLQQQINFIVFFVSVIHLGVELWCTCTFGRGSEEILSLLYFCRLFWLYLTNSRSNVL